MAEKKSDLEAIGESELRSLFFNTLKKSTTSTEKIEEKAEDILDKVSSRAKVNAWFDEYTVTEDFINKVRRYSRLEIDGMLLSLSKSVLGIALGTAIALLVTFLITGKFS